MCEPTSIALASLALAAGGTAYGISENQAAVADKNKAEAGAAQRSEAARVAETERQRKMSDAAYKDWQQQLSKSGASPLLGAIDNGATQATETAADLQASTGLSMGQLPGAEGTSQTVTEDTARRTNLASTRARQRIAAMATLSGYDAGAAGQAIGQQQFGSNLALGNNLRAGSLGVSRLEGNTLVPTTNAPNQLGGAAQSLGAIGAQYAGSQGAYNNWFGTAPKPAK